MTNNVMVSGAMTSHVMTSDVISSDALTNTHTRLCPMTPAAWLESALCLAIGDRGSVIWFTPLEACVILVSGSMAFGPNDRFESVRKLYHEKGEKKGQDDSFAKGSGYFII